MLEAIAVKKQFGAKLALDDVSLHVAHGDIYCLLGANGAGKTTLINLFLDFIQPTSGRLLIDNTDVTAQPLETALFDFLKVRSDRGKLVRRKNAA